MTTNFPTSLDSFTNPTGSDLVSAEVGSRTHSEFHSDNNDALEAIEAKVGVDGSAVTTSHDYKLSEVTGSDKAVGKTATQTLTNKTLTSAVLGGTTDATGGTLNVTDSTFNIKDNSDATKIIQFQASSITTGTTRTLTAQDVSGTLYVTGGTDVAIADGGTGQSTATLGFNALSPLTTKADIITRDGTNNIRLGVGADNTVLVADSAQTSGLKWATIGSIASGKITTSTTPVTVAATVTETTLFTTSIAGSTLGTDSVIRFRIYVSDFDTNASDGFDLRLKYGGTTIATAAIGAPIGTTDNNKGFIDGYIIGAGTTSSQVGVISIFVAENASEVNGAANITMEKVYATGSGTAAVDSTSSQTMLVSIQWQSTNAGNSITADWWVVESIR